MNKHHPHNNIIESKLEQLPVADADLLWNDMHSILDKKMPQKKERRRFIVWWFLSGKSLLLLTVFFLVTGSSLFFLSTKESSTVTIKKLPDSPQSNKFIEDDPAIVSKESKENVTTATKPNQRVRDNISATARSVSAVDHEVNNNFITRQTLNQSEKSIVKEQFNLPVQEFEKYTEKDQFNPPIQESEKYTAKDQVNLPIQTITKVSANFEMRSVDLKSIYQDFLIATNHTEEKKPFSRQLDSVADKAKMLTRNNNETGVYAGIIGGVDLSSIHFKSVKTGATMGLIIGYAFNKKWSIESGLLWDTKRVYDNGTYFNPPGYTPTSGITIIAVNGRSRLYELPVNMKYTIISGKHSLFTTAGLSSYLMRSENYDYAYLQNNQPGGHNYLSYTNETQNWFSVVNLGIGYTHKLGGNGSIRVEPYLKLPIKNLGVANMPIMSTGLNIGFTKPLRR